MINADSDVAAEVVAAARGRGLQLFTVGARGEALKLTAAERDGFATRIDDRFLRAARTRCAYRCRAISRSRTRWSRPACASRPAASPSAVFAALERLEGAPGRLERIGDKAGAPVFVDYAHKPDALEKTLAALRPFVAGRLVRGVRLRRRPRSRQAADHGGDRRPRRRSRLRHRRQSALRGPGGDPRRHSRRLRRGAHEIADRGEAIRAAVAVLEPGDALVIAGKGHETGQIVGDRTLPFSDAEVARAALEGAA